MPKFNRLIRFLLLAVFAFGLLFACNTQQLTQTPQAGSKTLIVGSSPWPGFAGYYVALAKNFFAAEGITVEDQNFQIATDVNTLLVAGKFDIAWTGVPDLVTLAGQDPSLRLIVLSDYSNGADGILARNIFQPADLKGKEVAWEGLPLQALLLHKYLQMGGLSEKDIKLLNIPAAEAASAFAAKKVDVALTYEPWLSKATKEGKGKVVFSSRDSNIIPVGLIAKESVIQKRKPEILAYMRAVDKGVQFVRENPKEAAQIVAKKLGVPAAEVSKLLDTVRMFSIEENKTIVFNPKDPLNVFSSIEFAAKTGKEMKTVAKTVEPKNLYDDSLVNAL